jgi:RNA polymerase sigma-70 factor (sigma-E family)
MLQRRRPFTHRTAPGAGGFDEFVAARGQALLRFAFLLTSDRHHAEDLVQEALARTHNHWGRVERMHAPEAYVRKAIVREYLTWRRRKASGEAVLADPAGVTGQLPLADWPVPPQFADPAGLVVARAQMWTLLAELTRPQRTVLVLRFYLDLPDDEIAALLGCAQATVRSHAARALTRLRERLRGQRALEVDNG